MRQVTIHAAKTNLSKLIEAALSGDAAALGGLSAALRALHARVLQQDENDHNFDFIKAFVDMAHALKLSVVAEGVETSDTLQFLRNADCDEAQGYFLAKPLSLADFEAYLSRLPKAG